jgi:hypothetical protein
LKVIPDALKVISDVLNVISDDLPSCFLVVFLQIVETGRYSRYTRYAATKFAAFNVKSSSYIALRPLWAVKNEIEM